MRAIRFDRAVRVPARVLSRELDDELVLLDLEAEVYYGLDAVGTSMWRRLVVEPDIESAFAELTKEFEVDAAILRRDFARLLDELLDCGLLELVEPASERDGPRSP